MAKADQTIQANQYSFPYHFIPEDGARMRLSRHWGFAASYMAALGLVANQLRPFAERVGMEWRHIDIGCGDGALIHHLARLPELPQERLGGVDIDARAIAWARLFSPLATFHVGDMGDLTTTYHSATLIEVLEHIPPDDLQNFMTSVASLLKPNGLLVVTVPSVEKPVASKHFQHFSFESIRSVIEPNFDNISVFGFEYSDLMCRMIDRVRRNRFARVDAPALNRILVKKLSHLRQNQRGCGRLLVTARRKA